MPAARPALIGLAREPLPEQPKPKIPFITPGLEDDEDKSAFQKKLTSILNFFLPFRKSRDQTVTIGSIFSDKTKLYDKSDKTKYAELIQDLQDLQSYIWVKNKKMLSTNKEIGRFFCFMSCFGMLCTLLFLSEKVYILFNGTLLILGFIGLVLFLFSRSEEAKLGSKEEFIRRKSLGY